MAVRCVAIGAEVWRIVPAELEVGSQVLVGHHQRQMRKHICIVEEERAIAMTPDELKCGLPDARRCIVPPLPRSVGARIEWVGAVGESGMARDRRIVVQREDAAVVAKKAGVQRVRLRLAEVAEPAVETALRGVAGPVERPQPPLAEEAGGVAARAQALRERRDAGGQVPLSLARARGPVVAHRGVSGMTAGEQHAARGGADGAAAVMPREAQPFAREPVRVRRADFRLAIAAELAPPEVVGQHEDDVRRAVGRERERRGSRRGKHQPTRRPAHDTSSIRPHRARRRARHGRSAQQREVRVGLQPRHGLGDQLDLRLDVVQVD